MSWKKEWKALGLIISIFIVSYYLPVGYQRFDNAINEAFYLLKDYAREHVLLCLIPAFFIAGAISVFVSQASVMKYLGAKANKALAYSVASIAGSILAVCSCTVLPLFSGIYKMGAGLGPATTFLYSGPAINVLAIVLTASVLGPKLGLARAIGAISFSIIIGLIMHLIFYKEEVEKLKAAQNMPEAEVQRPLWQNGIYFACMVGILIFANWGKPQEASGDFWRIIFSLKWILTSLFSTLFALILIFWFKLEWWKILIISIPIFLVSIIFPANHLLIFGIGIIGLSLITSTSQSDTGDWFWASWGFAKQILPLLFFGVIVAGLLLGRPGQEGLIPSEWITWAVGGNSFSANFFASFAGAFMYFATLTEIPILQGLIGNGMGEGPALALLLAGPALSLPNMLFIRNVMGTKKTIVYVSLVIIMATLTGIVYGEVF